MTYLDVLACFLALIIGVITWALWDDPRCLQWLAEGWSRLRAAAGRFSRQAWFAICVTAVRSRWVMFFPWRALLRSLARRRQRVIFGAQATGWRNFRVRG